MKKTQVMMLGSIHGFHKDNEFYSYKDLFNLIERYQPDIIGVEVRPEDLNQPKDYLTNFYPYEMTEIKYRYEKTCKVYGFDWFEERMEGSLLSEEYFEKLEVKNLEKELAKDDSIRDKMSLLEVIDEIRHELIINHNAIEVNNGNYDIASKIFYKQLKLLLNNTKYQPMEEFYRNRDAHIDQNIINIIEKHHGKKLLFVMGLDHRGFAIDAVKEHFGNHINLVPISSFID